jgi:hypothetical protein
VFSPEVERLAEAIGGTQLGDVQLERHVRLVAEAQIDMLRVRQARDRFLACRIPFSKVSLTAWTSFRKAQKSLRLFYSRKQGIRPRTAVLLGYPVCS